MRIKDKSVPRKIDIDTLEKSSPAEQSIDINVEMFLWPKVGKNQDPGERPQFIKYGNAGNRVILPVTINCQGTTYQSREQTTFGQLTRGGSALVTGYELIVDEGVDGMDLAQINNMYDGQSLEDLLKLNIFVMDGDGPDAKPLVPQPMIFRTQFGLAPRGRTGQPSIQFNGNVNVPQSQVDSQTRTNAATGKPAQISVTDFSNDTLPGLQSLLEHVYLKGITSNDADIRADFEQLIRPNTEEGGYMGIRQTPGTAPDALADKLNLSDAVTAGADALAGAAVGTPAVEEAETEQI